MGLAEEEEGPAQESLDLLQEAGVQVLLTPDELSDWYPKYQYFRLAISVPSLREPLADRLLHELSHLQLCPPWRRRLTDYGLGLEYLRGHHRSALVPEKRGDVEEVAARVLTAAWVHSLWPMKQRWHDYLRRARICSDLTCNRNLRSHFADPPLAGIVESLRAARLIDRRFSPQRLLAEKVLFPRRCDISYLL